MAAYGPSPAFIVPRHTKHNEFLYNLILIYCWYTACWRARIFNQHLIFHEYK